MKNEKFHTGQAFVGTGRDVTQKVTKKCQKRRRIEKLACLVSFQAMKNSSEDDK